MLEAEVKLDRSLDESIGRKLDFDGRWSAAEPLPVGEALSRLSSLTKEESNYLGGRMGWDQPFFNGIEWRRVTTRDLIFAAAGRLLMEDLRALYPAPAATDQKEQL